MTQSTWKKRLKKIPKNWREKKLSCVWIHMTSLSACFQIGYFKAQKQENIRSESEVKGVTQSFSAHFFTLSCFSSSSINQRATIARVSDTESVLCGLRGSRRIFIITQRPQTVGLTYHHAPRWKCRACRADWPHIWSRHTHAAHVSHILLTDGSLCDLVSERRDASGAFVSAPVSHECTFGRGPSVFWHEKNKVR